MTITIEQARGWYTNDDPVHDFNHVLRVYGMAEHIGQIVQADLEILHAAALLHDAEGSGPDTGTRASHHHQSAAFAQQVLEQDGWTEDRIEQVLHCIRAHRFRSDGETPQTLEARVLFDADKLDVLGAIGVARVIGYASIKRQQFYAAPSELFLNSGKREPGEPHSAYHEFLFKLRKIKDRLYTTPAKEIAAEREAYLIGFFDRIQDEIAGRK